MKISIANAQVGTSFKIDLLSFVSIIPLFKDLKIGKNGRINKCVGSFNVENPPSK
jgi:hypothetical protein